MQRRLEFLVLILYFGFSVYCKEDECPADFCTYCWTRVPDLCIMCEDKKWVETESFDSYGRSGGDCEDSCKKPDTQMRMNFTTKNGDRILGLICLKDGKRN